MNNMKKLILILLMLPLAVQAAIINGNFKSDFSIDDIVIGQKVTVKRVGNRKVEPQFPIDDVIHNLEFSVSGYKLRYVDLLIPLDFNLFVRNRAEQLSRDYSQNYSTDSDQIKKIQGVAFSKYRNIYIFMVEPKLSKGNEKFKYGTKGLNNNSVALAVDSVTSEIIGMSFNLEFESSVEKVSEAVIGKFGEPKITLEDYKKYTHIYADSKDAIERLRNATSIQSFSFKKNSIFFNLSDRFNSAYENIDSILIQVAFGENIPSYLYTFYFNGIETYRNHFLNNMKIIDEDMTNYYYEKYNIKKQSEIINNDITL